MIQNLPYPSIERIKEVTAFKSDAHANGALKTLRWLDRGAPHKFESLPIHLDFNMSNYMLRDYDEESNVCGTTCCIAGAIKVFATNGDVVSNRQIFVKLDDEFGISRYDMSHPLSLLFYPMDHGIFGITPTQAAVTFRRYLFTGEVKWN